MDWRIQYRVARALYRRWRMQVSIRQNGMQVSDKPALNSSTERWLRTALTQARLYLEFGAGASTILASRAGLDTIAVESDAAFAAAVEAALAPGHSVLILAGGIGWTEEWGAPVFQWRTAGRRAVWRRYTDRALAEVRRRGQFPDLILIDGRFRCSCALATAKAAAEAGASALMLFDDYAERPHYHMVERFLGPPEMIERAALFRISPSSLLRSIDDDMLTQVAADIR